jgi:hypothetical protein
MWISNHAQNTSTEHILGSSDKYKPGVIIDETPGLIRITSCFV